MKHSEEKVLFRQHTSYGCGLYAIANAFSDSNLITNERLEISKNGNYLTQLSRWLHESQMDYFEIEPLYCNLLCGFAPPANWEVHPRDENQIFPFLLQIMFKEGGKSHLISGRVDHSGNIGLIDSLRDNVIVTDWREIMGLKIYPVISAVYGFCDKRTSDGWLVLNKD